VRVLVQGEPYASTFETSPKGALLAVPGVDGSISIFDLQGGVLSKIDRGADRSGYVAFHPNGRWLAASSSQGNLSIWETRSGKLVKRISYPKGSSGRVAWTRGGRRIVVIGGKDWVYRFGVDR
jgi:WD40 repeat protein